MNNLSQREGIKNTDIGQAIKQKIWGKSRM